MPDPEVVKEAADAVGDAITGMKETIMSAHREAFDQHAKALDKADARARLDLDVRGILAIMAVLGVFGLAAAELVILNNAEVPAWAAALVAAVTGFYFGSRAGGNGSSH